MRNSHRRALWLGLFSVLLALLTAASVSADPPDPSFNKQPLPPIPNAPTIPPFIVRPGSVDNTQSVVDFTSNQDSWIASGPNVANTNRGGDQILYMGFDGRIGIQAERTLVYFDLDTLPAGAVIDSAHMGLTLYGSQGGGEMRIAARRISGDWSENGVTWNNTPSYDNATDWASSTIGTTTGRWSWDLSDLTRRWVGGQYINEGVIMIGDETPRPDAYDRGFLSREASSDEQRPKLSVTYTTARILALPQLTGGDGRFTVSWTADSNSSIQSWDVQYRAKSPTGSYSGWNDWQIGTTATSATFQGGHNQIYQFQVRVNYNSGAHSTYSNASSEVWVDGVPPTVAFNPLPQFSGPNFTVSWVGNDDGTGIKNYDFEIYDNEVPVTNFQTTATSHPITNGVEGHTYGFRVRARDNADNVSDWQTVRTTVQTARPKVSINALPPISAASFTVSWILIDAAGGIAQYTLEIYDNGQFLQSISTTALSYNFSGGLDGHTYSFRVRAQNLAGAYSDWTPYVHTVVDAQPPTVSISVGSRYQSQSSIAVQWAGVDAVSGVAAYDVQVRLGAGAWTDWLIGVTSTSGVYNGAAGQTYSFRVRARDAIGNYSGFTADDAAVVTITSAGVSGRVLGNRGLPIVDSPVASVPTAVNAPTVSTGLGGYDLYWETVESHQLSASNPSYLPFPPITLPAQSGVQEGVDIYLRPTNDVIANGSFESGLTGWNVVGTVPTDATSHSGSAAARLTPGNSLSQRVSVPSNPTPSVVAFLYRIESGNSGALLVNFENVSTGGANITNQLPLTGGNGWQHAYFDLSQLAGAQFDLRFTLSAGATGASVVIDEINLGAAQPNRYFQLMPIVQRNSNLSGATAATATTSVVAKPPAGLPTDGAPVSTPTAPSSADAPPAIDLSKPGHWTDY